MSSLSLQPNSFYTLEAVLHGSIQSAILLTKHTTDPGLLNELVLHFKVWKK